MKMIELPGALLEAVGSLLHGEQWQAPLARDLDIGLRTVERWAAAARRGEGQRVSRSLLPELLALLETKAEREGQVMAKLRQLAG